MSVAAYFIIMTNHVTDNMRPLQNRGCVSVKEAHPQHFYILNSSRTVMSFLSNGLSERMASLNGTYTISLLRTPIITLRCPCIMASIAPTPVRLANMRS